MTKKIQIAICYDFDGTLSPKNMQEYDFMKEIKMTPKKFWKKVKELAKKHNADETSVYMKLMIDESKKNENSFTEKTFKDYGKAIELFKGVDTWFSRINKYGREQGIVVNHFIISSGLKEMIEGTKIARQFKKIYASSFIYDSNTAAEWPAVVLNFTTKTKYLFEINKGKNCSNINKYVPDEDREIPFSNMIYIGDGETDVPCMKIVKKEGGHSIAVYKPKSSKKKIAERLVKEDRVNFISPADYSENSIIERLVKSIINKIISDKNLYSFKHKKISGNEVEKGKFKKKVKEITENQDNKVTSENIKMMEPMENIKVMDKDLNNSSC